MKQYKITGQQELSGEVTISGSKNVVTKALIAACLTDEEVVIENVPDISDVKELSEIIESIGGSVVRQDSTLVIKVPEIKSEKISLSAGRVRTTSLFLSPLLLRCKKAVIPNPKGCRLGARPIDRHIEGLQKMGAEIEYASEDGYYHARTDGLSGTEYTFEKNTHTGTETLIMAATLAKGKTVLHNAAEEHEIDDLISLLNKMGAKITRLPGRKIEIEGVGKLHGATHRIVSDGNELVTFAALSAITGGNIWIKEANLENVKAFLQSLKEAGVSWEERNEKVRFYVDKELAAVKITTAIEPGFKTDWQGPWAVLMTQANGKSIIHETIYENRFGYVSELQKMGANISYVDIKVDNPEKTYNFDYDPTKNYKQSIEISGPTSLHEAVLNISDLRAGATVVLAALIAKGESTILGVEHIDRGYENFDKRLIQLGAKIEVTE